MSTSRRLIFYTLQLTSSSASNNDLLEEGKRKLNKVVETAVRWYNHEINIKNT